MISRSFFISHFSGSHSSTPNVILQTAATKPVLNPGKGWASFSSLSSSSLNFISRFANVPPTLGQSTSSAANNALVAPQPVPSFIPHITPNQVETISPIKKVRISDIYDMLHHFRTESLWSLEIYDQHRYFFRLLAYLARPFRPLQCYFTGVKIFRFVTVLFLFFYFLFLFL